MHTCWVSARLRERDDPSPNRVPRAEGAENRAASARAQLRAYVPSTSKVIECFTGLTYLLTYLLSDRVQFVRCLSPESDQRGLNCAASSDVGLGAGAHTHRRSWTRVGAKTLALMNTPAELVPTEDTSAVAQEQASLQEQLLARTLTVVLGHCPL